MLKRVLAATAAAALVWGGSLLAQSQVAGGAIEGRLMDESGAVLPGGNGLTFDWRLLLGRVWRKPWMLAGGLTPGNVALAIRSTNARQVDVASGVETAPGVKDEALIRAFIAAAKSAA